MLQLDSILPITFGKDLGSALLLLFFNDNEDSENLPDKILTDDIKEVIK